mmetsp:Transcript_8256/g.14249  ORF Transcript_8256/g.14249 Transcript_8256/m.14249 type:complete len:250 (+) Transcript_8256:60-809(+)
MGGKCCKGGDFHSETRGLFERAPPPPPPPPKDSRSCTGVVYSSICGDEYEERGRPGGPYKQAEAMNRNDGGFQLWKQSDVQAMQGNVCTPMYPKAMGYGNAAAVHAQAYGQQAKQAAASNYAAASYLAGDYYNQAKGQAAGYQQQARGYQNQNQNSGGGFFDGLFGGGESQPQTRGVQDQARGTWNAASVLAQDRAGQAQQQAQGFWNAGRAQAGQYQQQGQGMWNAGSYLAQDKANQARQQANQGGWF